MLSSVFAKLDVKHELILRFEYIQPDKHNEVTPPNARQHIERLAAAAAAIRSVAASFYRSIHRMLA